ncbi:pyrroloquinoline quinone precursor peptide PqqA [Paraburkholderia megapolitana]
MCTKPVRTDVHHGFEITMYIANS